MTIANTPRKSGPFVGTGSEATFSFAFKIFNRETDLKVYRSLTSDSTSIPEELTYGTDYTVVLNEDQDENPGGTVTLTEALETGKYLTILSNVSYDQNTKFTNYDNFMPTLHNDALDKLTALTQQLKEQNGRTITVPPTSSETPQGILNSIFIARDTAVQKASEASISAQNASQKEEIVTQKYNLVSPHFIAIEGVYANRTNLTTVAESIGDVTTVAQNNAKVTTVADNIGDVGTTADNIADIGTCADNIQDIKDAHGNAELAKIYAVGQPHEPTTGHSAQWYAEHMTVNIKGEYSSSTTYSKNNIVKVTETSLVTFYISLKDNNVGNPVSATSYWKYIFDINTGVISIDEDTYVLTASQKIFTLQPFTKVMVFIEGVIDAKDHEYTISGYTVTFDEPLPVGTRVQFVRFGGSQLLAGKASANELGLVKIGDGISIDEDGKISPTGFVPTTRTVNGYALSSDVTVSATDVLPSVSGKKHQVLRVNNAGNGVEWYDLLPVGSMMMFGKDQSHTGFLKCDGSTFSQSDYPELYAYLGTNVLPNIKVSVNTPNDVPVFGNGTSIGLFDGTNKASLRANTEDYYRLYPSIDAYGKELPTTDGNYYLIPNNTVFGLVTKTASAPNYGNSGVIADMSGIASRYLFIKY